MAMPLNSCLDLDIFEREYFTVFSKVFRRHHKGNSSHKYKLHDSLYVSDYFLYLYFETDTLGSLEHFKLVIQFLYLEQISRSLISLR